MRRAWWRSWARLRNSRRCAFSPRHPVVRWATGPMKALLWLSDPFRRLNPRERRVVLGGALVSATALVLVLLGLPFTHRWAVREAAYTASREQWLRFAALTANTDRLQQAVGVGREGGEPRSEEHTSELQSRLHLVCRLLLEKKKMQAQQCRAQTISAATR